VTLRPWSTALLCAVASAAAFLAAAALAPGSSTPVSAPATEAHEHAETPLLLSPRRPRLTRRQRILLNAVRRARTPGGGHAKAVAEGQFDPPPAPCSPSLAGLSGPEMSEGTTESGLPLAAGTDLSAVMIFVDFFDVRATESTTQLHNRLVPNARAWYAEASYGRATLDVTPIHRWFRMARGSRDYGIQNGLTFAEHKHYVADALAAADAEVDFSRYRIVYVVAARGSALLRSPAFHAVPGDGIAVDGVEVRHSATFGEDVREVSPPGYGSNVVVHETGHLLGLPDLYDGTATDYSRLFRFTGDWDAMSSTNTGAHFLAWHKWKLGWIDQTQLTCLHDPGEVTATISPAAAASGLKAVVVPTGPSTAFVIEARRRSGQDARLCEAGVLIYSVDALVHSGAGPIRVQPAQRDRNPELVESCGDLYNAPFDRAAGEDAHFYNRAAGLRVEVLGSNRSGYRVRVTRSKL
jgi:M6 family metalloprotease-like protein